MNDEQIVLSLLNFYKSQGVDLHYLLDDIIFGKLSVQVKVDAIKRHAAAILSGTPAGFGRKDARAVGNDMLFNAVAGGMTGAATTMATAKLYSGGRPSIGAVLIGAGAGAGVGIAASLLNRVREHQQRQSIRGRLQAVVDSPTDDNALGTLAFRNMQRGIGGIEGGGRLYDEILGRMHGMVNDRAHDRAHAWTMQGNDQAGRQLL